MTMIERLARALAESGGGSPHGWELYADDARAALQAIREPGDDMLKAVRSSMPNGASEPIGSDQELIAAWRAMIDTALATE